MRGRGRESERVEMSHHLGKSEPVEAPPHPNPLPASGEREPRGVRGTFVPDPSSRDLPGRAILGVLKRDAHGCEFVSDAVGLRKVLGVAGSTTRSHQRFDFIFVNLTVTALRHFLEIDAAYIDA